MKFPAPIQKGILVKRYKRFLSDIELDGKTITAHCANPGSMMGVKDEGATVWVTAATNLNRKLQWDWQIIEVGAARVCINTALANKIVHEALTEKSISELSGYNSIRPEVKYGENSRIDFLLSEPDLPDCYVEVKNVTLSRSEGLAEFPDSPTARGTKHLKELAAMAQAGHRAVMLYLVNRTDCTKFSLARDIDPEYAFAFNKATQSGVESLAFGTKIDLSGIKLDLPISKT